MLCGSALPFMGQFGFIVSFGRLRLTSGGADDEARTRDQSPKPPTLASPCHRRGLATADDEVIE
jgi:hypothetical protein